MDRKECYRLTHPLSKISEYVTASSKKLVLISAASCHDDQLSCQLLVMKASKEVEMSEVLVLFCCVI